MKLTLYNPSNNTWKELVDTSYKPYFFVPHPLSKKDREVTKELEIKTTVEEKMDLFTGQAVKVTRLELDDYSDPLLISKKFSKSWENEVPIVSGYVFDKGLTFGAQHYIKGKEITSVLHASKEDMENFERAFGEVKKKDREKYELSKKWFILCSQPVPKIYLARLGIQKRFDPEQYYLTFMLSRLANLSLPKAYYNRQVSTWIKSILHNHLRKKNILIPTSKELRRGEPKRSVQGALTMTPEAGVHFNTVVVDFESLYPSLIDAYNLSYETIDCPHEEDQKNIVPGLEHHVCTTRRGVYSVLIGSLKDLRIHWFKPRAKDKTEAKVSKTKPWWWKLLWIITLLATIASGGYWLLSPTCFFSTSDWRSGSNIFLYRHRILHPHQTIHEGEQSHIHTPRNYPHRIRLMDTSRY